MVRHAGAGQGGRDAPSAAPRRQQRQFFLNRVENFFERASLPNPDRFYTDDSFASDHYDELLTPEFRRAVARDASLDWMRDVYRLGATRRAAAPRHAARPA